MTVRERLEQITLRIEQSPVSQEYKNQLYLTLREALKAAVEPILLQYLPQAQLKFLSEHPEKISPENFVVLIQNTLIHTDAAKEINQLMLEILDVCEKNLPKEIIARS